MKNLKHTKGEWRYSELYQVITDEEGYSIAQESGLKHSKDWEANAKLISAAPDLLEACIKGFDLCNKLKFPTEQELKDLKLLFENTINKATK